MCIRDRAGDSGFVPNVTYAIWPGDFTMNDSPETVRDKLTQLGITIENGNRRDIADRQVVFGLTQNPNSVSATYVIPDFGYAIAMTFTASGDAGLQQLADNMAATVLGC